MFYWGTVEKQRQGHIKVFSRLNCQKIIKKYLFLLSYRIPELILGSLSSVVVKLP